MSDDAFWLMFWITAAALYYTAIEAIFFNGSDEP